MACRLRHRLAAALLRPSRHTQIGVLDPTFGVRWPVTAVSSADDFQARGDRATGRRPHRRRRRIHNTSSDDFCVVRYLLGGTLDPSFR